MIRKAAQNKSWVIRSIAVDIMLSIALADISKYGPEAIEMAEKAAETKEEVLSAVGTYVSTLLKSLSSEIEDKSPETSETNKGV